MFIFEPVSNWISKYRKNNQDTENFYMLGYEIFGNFRMRYENLKRNLDGL